MSLDKSINDAVAATVNTKIEAEVLKALSSDDVMSTFVQAALNEKVDVDRYGSKKTTLLNQMVGKSIQETTKAVVQEEILKAEPAIREQVRKAVAESLDVITDSLVDGFVENIKGGYPSISVAFDKEL